MILLIQLLLRKKCRKLEIFKIQKFKIMLLKIFYLFTDSDLQVLYFTEFLVI